jgi:hypothetical protein
MSLLCLFGIDRQIKIQRFVALRLVPTSCQMLCNFDLHPASLQEALVQKHNMFLPHCVTATDSKVIFMEFRRLSNIYTRSVCMPTLETRLHVHVLIASAAEGCQRPPSRPGHHFTPRKWIIIPFDWTYSWPQSLIVLNRKRLVHLPEVEHRSLDISPATLMTQLPRLVCYFKNI